MSYNSQEELLQALDDAIYDMSNDVVAFETTQEGDYRLTVQIVPNDEVHPDESSLSYEAFADQFERVLYEICEFEKIGDSSYELRLPDGSFSGDITLTIREDDNAGYVGAVIDLLGQWADDSKVYEGKKNKVITKTQLRKLILQEAKGGVQIDPKYRLSSDCVGASWLKSTFYPNVLTEFDEIVDSFEEDGVKMGKVKKAKMKIIHEYLKGFEDEVREEVMEVIKSRFDSSREELTDHIEDYT